MKRDLKFSKEKIYKGVEKLAKGVGSTLGPKGRPVLINDEHAHARPTKDGVTVAKYTELSDHEENIGAKFITQAALSTVQMAGDGTTTSTVLAHNIIKDADESVDFVKGIEAAKDDVVAYLEDAKEEMTDELIEQIAYISTNNDEELAGLITKAFAETGDKGVVDVKYSPTASETSLDVKYGSMLHAGYSHQHFITNMRARTCELENPLILISNATFNEVGELEHILMPALKTKRPIVIIGDTEKNFNETFLSNVQNNNLTGCIINPGQRATVDALRDLAALLGGVFFDNASGNTFDYVGEDHWGESDSVIIGQGFSLFTVPSNEHVQDRIEDLDKLVEEDGPNAEDYKLRLQMLNGKYATITVGAPTQGQALEIKDRIDDAVLGVGAAQKFGYLPGGGTALLSASKNIPNKDGESDFDKGYNHLLEAIKSPFHKILSNAGLDCDCDFEDGHGIDASNGERVKMIDAGIIDPALVTTQAVINAVSAASTLLLCEATLIIENETN